MAQCDEAAPTRLEVIPALQEQASILANLLELYAHDFSEFRELEIGEDGRFGYYDLPLYWSEPDRYPFLLRNEGKWAGLVLVKKRTAVSGTGAVWDMEEFFVVRGCRRRGMGTQAAHDVWRRFPGTWQVRVMRENIGAQHFWAGTISTFTGEVVYPTYIESGDRHWSLFSFDSRIQDAPASFRCDTQGPQNAG